MQEMVPPPSGRDLELLWSQATFLKVSFRQKVSERYLKCSAFLDLLDLASSAVSQRRMQSHTGHIKKHWTWLFHSSLFLPNQQSPWLYGQKCVSTPSTGRLAEMITFSTPETEWVQSQSLLGKLSPAMSFSWLEIFSFLSVLIHGPYRPISSCANALI